MPTARKNAVATTTARSVLKPEILAQLPDLNDSVVLARIKASVKALDPEDEAEALRWIESVYDDTDWK